MRLEEATAVDDELVEAWTRLLGQLSRPAQAPSVAAPAPSPGAQRGVLPPLPPPVPRPARPRPGQVLRGPVEQQPERSITGLLLFDGDHVIANPDDGRDATASAAGAPAAWARALVTERTTDLEIAGDAALARDALAGVRAALLSYIR